MQIISSERLSPVLLSALLCASAVSLLGVGEPAGEARIAELKARLADKPDDQPARRELLVRYVVDRDDPKSARRYSSEVEDELWKDCVLLASRDVAELDEEDLLKTGLWYRGLGGKAKGAPRLAMYRRARIYYERFLAVHTKQGPERDEAESILRSVVATVNSLERAAASPRKTTPKPGGAASRGAAGPNDGLALHWTFDPATVTDDKVTDLVAGHEGRLAIAEVSDAPRGGAIDGHAGLADIPRLRHEGSYSVAVWVYLRLTPDQAVAVVDKTSSQGRGGRQYYLGIRAEDRRPITTAGGGGGVGQPVEGDASLPTDAWAHLVMTQRYDGRQTHVKFYINARPAGEGHAQGKTLNSAADVEFGLSDGRIDDLRIYHRALSDADVAAIYTLDAMPDQPEPAPPAAVAADDSEEMEEEMESNASSSSEFFGIKIK